MHYRVSVVIDQPRDRVAQLLQDPDALPHWQKGFVSITPQQGEPGAPGSTAMLAYQMGKRGRVPGRGVRDGHRAAR